MYLKSVQINNFRKFGEQNQNNKIIFKRSEFQQRNGEEINVAPSTTLIVGKNNSGKSTIINALDILVNKGEKFRSTDFNFLYLKKLLTLYKTRISELEKNGEDILENLKDKIPHLEFEFVVGLNDNPDDLLTNLVDFLKIEDVEKIESTEMNGDQLNNFDIKIKVKVEIKETAQFFDKVKKLISGSTNDDEISKIRQFKSFLKIIDEIGLKTKYYRENDGIENDKREVKDFKLSNLINLYTITANNIKSENALSKAFGTIIQYRYKELIEKEANVEETIENKETLEKESSFNIEEYITNINDELTRKIKDKHTNDINTAIQRIESPEKLQVYLGANLTFEKLFSGLIDVEYVEGNNLVPENQFGLGYTNLMMIIAQIIEFLENYPENTPNSRVNLISIEEPETFMHPQMQELFITHINEAVSALLKSKKKNINSQLIITTHSSHILNSKIHNGNSFDYINYVTNVNKESQIVNLFDENIVDKNNGDNTINDLKFLKKHIKYKVSELFFSDAIIFVEGVSEEILLKYFIENDKKLNKYYISIFNIDGAHAYIYHNLITQLKVPCLIITDLDIKREKEEKSNDTGTFIQIANIEDRVTTNKTLIKYNKGSDRIKDLTGIKIEEGDNLCVVHQWQVEDEFFPTSFEEALILTNYKKETFKKILEDMKPQIYQEIVGNSGLGIDDNERIKNSSFKLQFKLSKDKSEFANRILYQQLSSDNSDEIELPEYIKEGLTWLTKKLKGERDKNGNINYNLPN